MCKDMVDKRAMTRARALSGWLSSCRAMVGEVKRATFRNLMEALVAFVSYRGVGRLQSFGGSGTGADASGTDILGVGGLHCRVFLQFEMQMIPLRFQVQKRCSEF